MDDFGDCDKYDHDLVETMMCANCENLPVGCTIIALNRMDDAIGV